MTDLPHIGPISLSQARLDRVRAGMRAYLPWITTLVAMAVLALLAMDSFYVGTWSSKWMGLAAGLIVFLLNLALGLSDRWWPSVSPLGIRGLTQIDEWLATRPEWIDPVAGWLEACGDLDERHYLCLQQLAGGHRRPPREMGNGLWVLLMRSRDICENPHDLAGGRVRERVLDLMNQKNRQDVDHATRRVDRVAPRPRRL